MSHMNPDYRDGAQYVGLAEANSDTYASIDHSPQSSVSFHKDYLLRLHVLCENATEEDEMGWEEVRHWLRTHTVDQASQAAMQTGEMNTTALHLACRNCPPVDVVHLLLNAAQGTVTWTDVFGWLPLHYACAYGASEEVLRVLINSFSESRIATDKRGRTPLHFALGNTERPASPEAVMLLASTGAANCPDENGMLPLHYAGAYGASEATLTVLTDGNADSIIAVNRKGRTPLHFAMGNCDRDPSPGVVRLLLAQKPEVVNCADGENGHLPLHLLAQRAQTLGSEMKVGRDNARKCLELYLNGKPKATTEFLTGLQALPDWLRDRAVVTPVVQALLNEKISQRFPTAVLMLDLYFLCAIIATYSITVLQSIEDRFDEDPDNNGLSFIKLSPLYIGSIYFLIREVVQVMSLFSLGLFNTWLWDPTNWVDVTFIVVVMFWAIEMNTGYMEPTKFRTGTALSLMFLWLNFLSFLRGMLVDFAVFVSGVYHVLQRLVAFLTALIIILIAFMQIFYTMFRQTPYCLAPIDNLDGCPNTGNGNPRAFCNYWSSFMRVYTMLLGEVDDTEFRSSEVAVIFFAIFMFLVVILLANVLIAIVTDSYGVIKNERAAIVFWSNRLDFVAEMDVILSGPWKKKLPSVLSIGGDTNGSVSAANSRNDAMGEAWKKLFDLFEDDIGHLTMLSVEFWCWMILRVVTALIIIPLWLLLGVLSAGWLWPPQVRERLLEQRVSKANPGDANNAEHRMAQVKALRKDVKDLRTEVAFDITSDRHELIAMRNQMAAMKGDILREMKDVKQIMTMLFEVQSMMA